jgi:hypothetical protein
MGLPDELRILTNEHGKREQLHPFEFHDPSITSIRGRCDFARFA